MTRGGEASLTPVLAVVVLWVVLSTFNFGFGTSELNPLQRAITCSSPATIKNLDSRALSSLPPSCIALTNAQFGYITAGFTFGGFLGSIGLAPLKSCVHALRRSKNALLFAGAWNVAGGLIQASAASWPVLALGRACMGVGSGIALVVVPGYLNDVSPPAWQGSIGVLNQLSIVVGILAAQALGVSPLGEASPPQQHFGGTWRYIPLISSAIAAAQLLLAPFVVGAPSDSDDPQRAKERLWRSHSTGTHEGEAEADSLLASPPDEPDADTGSSAASSSSDRRRASTQPISIGALLSLALLPKRDTSLTAEQAAIRRGTRMIIFTQIAQQLSGVNAVLYYSTGILSEVLSGGGKSGDGGVASDRTARLIAVGITFVNFLMTFPPIPLIDERRAGRKRLLQASSGIMAISAAVLAVALMRSYTSLAAISIITFAAGFSIGLGPIPFLILPELVPRSAVATASSVGIGCNWLANILLASIFLPLKDAMGGGRVFFVFVVIDAVIFSVISFYYVYHAPTS